MMHHGRPGDPHNTLLKPGVKISFSIMLGDDATLSLTVGEPVSAISIDSQPHHTCTSCVAPQSCFGQPLFVWPRL